MDRQQIIFGVIIGILICILITSLVSLAFGEEIDLNIIRHLESRGNPFAVSKAGCIGQYQISKSVLKEYNKFHNSTYSTGHLFIPSINRRIALWYLTKRIPQMLRYYKLPTSLLYILASYNWGIGRVVKWHKKSGQFKDLSYETQRYIVNYIKGL